MRTGRRCTTLIQFPVAFCAGSSENAAPVPAPFFDGDITAGATVVLELMLNAIASDLGPDKNGETPV